MTRRKWNRTIINSAKLSCAFLMLAAPWLFDFASEGAAAWNAWLGGCVVLATTGRALATEGKDGIETALAMGIWMVISPSVLGFPGHTSAAMTHVLFGFAISALTVAESSRSHRGDPWIAAGEEELQLNLRNFSLTVDGNRAEGAVGRR